MAQVDAYLEIPGIEGESKDKKHPKLVELSHVSLHLRNEGSGHSGGGAGAGKVQFSDIQITKKHVDKASPKLMLACASGQHMDKATLYCRKAGGEQEDYFVWELENVFISSYQVDTHASGGSVLPSDHFTLNFGKITISYLEQDEKGKVGGKVKAGWDVKANVKA
jgi:type VI secretion system secreted protein Hcp